MISDDDRRQIASLARNPKRRAEGPRTAMGHRWEPRTVLNPESGMMFEKDSAWDLIARAVETGYPIEEITLDEPPGAVGLVLLVDLPGASRTLYIKVQRAGIGLLCRSFHYSTRADRHGTPWPPPERPEP